VDAGADLGVVEFHDRIGKRGRDGGGVEVCR
jgi:hypothetical protein